MAIITDLEKVRLQNLSTLAGTDAAIIWNAKWNFGIPMFKIAGSYQSLDQPDGMNTKTLAATAILALMLTGIATVAFAHTNPTFSSNTQNHDQTSASGTVQSKDSEKKNGEHGDHDDSGHGRDHRRALDLKVGDTITLSNLEGRFRQVGNQSVRGNASGSFTFTVTGVFKSGYTLSMTSGTIVIGDQTYTVNGGSLQGGPHGRSLVGQGTAGSGVQFLIHTVVHGKTAATNGMVMLDLQNGTTEYMVHLRTATSS